MTTNPVPYHIVVVVLGDLGRSPRMQYHTLSLLQQGHKVHFVGYTGEHLIDALTKYSHNGQLTVVRFPSMKIMLHEVGAKSIFRFLTWPLYLLWRIVSLTCLLSHALLFRVSREIAVDCLLVQNPPAVPLLMVAVAYCRFFTNAALVIDWHNLGYSMLPHDGAVRYLARIYEEFWAPAADGHLTVTKALQEHLESHMGITPEQNDNTSVLYDCPPAIFRLRSIKEQHKMLQTLQSKFTQACPKHWFDSLTSSSTSDDSTTTTKTFTPTQTLFTEEYAAGRCRPRQGRPALIVSATSWTRDENFGMLLTALQQLDEHIDKENKEASSVTSGLKVVCVLTGKGALKEAYEERISQLTWQHVAVLTCWLEPADYPVLLACADVGLSLHTSTSGMDLPIKILDYFGCEVPVCAYDFTCLKELVLDQVNGRTFVAADELATILWELLQPLTLKPDAGNHDFGPLKQFSLQIQGKMLW
jgi:beta-1,4-mannosyltransferase